MQTQLTNAIANWSHRTT